MRREITSCDQLSQVLQAGEAGGGEAAFEAGRSLNGRRSSLRWHCSSSSSPCLLPAPRCWQLILGMARTGVPSIPPGPRCCLRARLWQHWGLSSRPTTGGIQLLF